MRNLIVTLTLFTLASFFTACGGKGEKKSAVQVSPEMQDFMNNFNGRSASVTVALEQFGKAGLDDKDMDLYDLKEPKVLEATGSCYLLQCTAGMTKRKYNICWEGGKISSVEDKGMV